MTVETYTGFFQKYNVLIGIIVCVLIASVSLTIMPFGFLFLGDIYIALGCIFGLFITFKYKKESQPHIKTGLIVGLIGSVSSLVLSSILLSLAYGFDIVLSFWFIFANAGIIYVIIGLIVGYLFGYYNRKKEQEQKLAPLF